MFKQKILVALSGGVDSAVAAALLKKQGYDVTGVFMINWQDDDESCGWEKDYDDAREVARELGIKLFAWNFSVEYKKYVFDYLIKSYENGLTPNPDTLCNKYIKFGLFLERALKLGFEKIATGHYAKINKQQTTNNKQLMGNEKWKTIYHLIIARDKTKDQTYFLYELGQYELSHTIFPLGDLTKKQVRKLAHEFNLPVAKKKDSYGICFVGEKKMGEFLSRFIKPKVGEIVNQKGQVLGRHNGFHFYTLGQRQRVGIGGTGPYYVVRKDYATNQLVVTSNASDSDLYTQEFLVKDVNWILGKPSQMPLKCLVRCRHLQKLNPARLGWQGENTVKVTLKKPLKSVTSGQVAVFYQPLRSWFSRGFEVLGGGIIH